MIAQFNLGGDFGCVHRVFAAETIAPIIMGNGVVGRCAVDAFRY